MPPLTNCKPCLADRHDECNKDDCLCKVETNHNERKESLRDGVREDPNKPIDYDQFKDVWKEIYANQTEASEDSRSTTWDRGYEIAESDHDKIDKATAKIQENRRFVTDNKTDEILLYNGKIYDKLQAEALIKEETEKLIPNCTEHYRREVIAKIKAQTYRDLRDFDSDPKEITVLNGILSLETLKVRPHTPENFSRVLLAGEYIQPEHEDIEENLKYTLFWKALTDSFTVNGKFRPTDMQTVLEVMASTFLKKPIDQKAVMFLGSGENGKSVFLSYLIWLLGKNNVSSIPLQDLTNDKFLAANLDGKSANIFTDLEKNELRHTGKIKVIVSNEGIEVQKKGKQGYTLYPFCKLIFSCNRFPKVFDQSQGFFRRWIIVKWERNFENDAARDDNLLDKLLSSLEEKTLVFSCLVNLASQLLKAGKFTHSSTWKIVQRDWNANADPVADFDSRYIIDSDGNKGKRKTYQFYREICYHEGETPLGMGKFSKEFSQYHDEWIDKDGRTQRIWLNIDFVVPKDSKLEDFDFS